MRLEVTRADGAGTRVETYEVPEFEGMTVLDALNWVREHVDPSLAFRFSCRCANACKECLAVVNGERTYTCTVAATGTVTVEPLGHKPHVRDLVVKL
ncbi:2Fe-2S iron-sulfur cluster-binding protein [Streptosporangium sp. NPDC051022]|uniref:2Fe-2S iron-sulfur cluster-binding protein n=1 Tax=Streptosporangium sp. NPDC051022 TaxID=3155752 RepID=UPI0034268360